MFKVDRKNVSRSKKIILRKLLEQLLSFLSNNTTLPLHFIKDGEKGYCPFNIDVGEEGWRADFHIHTVLKIDAKQQVVRGSKEKAAEPRASSLPWRCDETTSSF